MYKKLKYLLQNLSSVAICYNVNKLYLAVKKRYPQEAIIYSSDNTEDLLTQANINQNRYCDNNSNEEQVIQQIALPSVITETTCLQNNNVIKMNLVAFNQMGEWAISALNGFCTARTDEDLYRFLACEQLAYPMACWYPLQHKQVVMKARTAYVNRFYSRYWFNAEQPFLPQKWLENFKDDYFEEREERRNVATKTYEAHRKFNEVRMDLGW